MFWLGEYEEDGWVRFRIGRDGDVIVAEWPGIATLRANERDGSRTFVAAPEADPNLVEKVHRSLAQALLRHLDQKLTLHGSAVTREGRAIGVVGASGAGKSTLAAALARCNGVAFAADDTLALELTGRDVTLLPTERESWLLPDACVALGIEPAAQKRSLPHTVLASPAQLAALVVPVFEEREDVTVARLRGTSLLSALVPSVIRFVIDDPRVQLREIEQLQRLSDAVPVFTLKRPRRIEALDDTVRAALALFESSP